MCQFRDGAAGPANQKLSGMRAARVRATNECIEGIQAMDQVGLDQEFQRAVDCRWRHFPARSIQAIEDIVCANRLVAVPDQLQYPPALLRKPKSSLAADCHRRRNGLRHTMFVIVFFAGEPLFGKCLDHFLCSHR